MGNMFHIRSIFLSFFSLSHIPSAGAEKANIERHCIDFFFPLLFFLCIGGLVSIELKNHVRGGREWK